MPINHTSIGVHTNARTLFKMNMICLFKYHFTVNLTHKIFVTPCKSALYFETFNYIFFDTVESTGILYAKWADDGFFMSLPSALYMSVYDVHVCLLACLRACVVLVTNCENVF